MSTAPLWTAETIAAATNGAFHHPFDVSGLSIDSRSVARGDLFIALKGPHFDGHSYVHEALGKGAAGALATRETPQCRAMGLTDRLILVSDTHAALESLARAARARCAAPLVAITGSVGKTGTRAMTQTALAALGRVHASQGNLNNEIGLPLSLARMPADTQYGVFEMGMNHVGEISALSRIAEPDVAVITTVAPAHLAFFKDEAEIARAKAEICDGIRPGGTVVLPRDNAHFDLLHAIAAARPALNILTFGSHPEADIRLLHHKCGHRGQSVTANTPNGEVSYCLPWLGRHHAANSTAVLAVLTALGVDAAAAMAALGNLEAIDGRGRCLELVLHDGPGWLVDESYNANPASVRAAIQGASDLKKVLGAKRLIVALGDMLELGDTENRLHAELADEIAGSDVAYVHTTGTRMRHLHDALSPRQRGVHAPDSAILAQTIVPHLRGGDLVMVKGSLGSRMGTVVRRLAEKAGEPPAEELGHAV